MSSLVMVPGADPFVWESYLAPGIRQIRRCGIFYHFDDCPEWPTIRPGWRSASFCIGTVISAIAGSDHLTDPYSQSTDTSVGAFRPSRYVHRTGTVAAPRS